MARLTDMTRYEDAQRFATPEALWELFDGDRIAFNIAHECIDRHTDGSGRIAVRVAHADGRDEALSFDALAAGFRVCEDSGASLAAVLARLAAMAADERPRRDEVALALAGPRSSALLLAALPALGVLAGAGLGASPLPFLLHRPAGRLCFLLGVGLDVLGAWWVGRLAASAGRPQRLS